MSNNREARANCVVGAVLLFVAATGSVPAQPHPPVLGLLFTPTLDHPWLDEQQLQASTEEELQQIAELLKEFEPPIAAANQPDSFGAWLIREWKRNLDDPLYPAKQRAAEKLARAANGPRRRTCLVEWPDHHELRRIKLQRWLLKEKYGIDCQPNPLEESLLNQMPKRAP